MCFTALRKFRYIADPICIVAAAAYILGRCVLRPHGVGGWLVHDYLNDFLCLPLFLPMILGLQRLLRLRRHDMPPRLWEVLQHWVVFSVIFEAVLPRYPHIWRTTADPWDVVAYLVGGLVAWTIWQRRVRQARHVLTTPATSHRYSGA